MLLPGARDAPWGLRVEHSVGRDPSTPWWQYDSQTDIAVIRGEEALRVAAQLLPTVNHKGGSKRRVREAITLIESTDADTLFRTAARVADRPNWNPDSKRGTLQHVPDDILLALEMISHEESERRAMEGELAILEAAWREAEEIAAISDDLFLPEAITTKLEVAKPNQGRSVGPRKEEPLPGHQPTRLLIAMKQPGMLLPPLPAWSAIGLTHQDRPHLRRRIGCGKLGPPQLAEYRRRATVGETDRHVTERLARTFDRAHQSIGVDHSTSAAALGIVERAATGDVQIAEDCAALVENANDRCARRR
jgi:hypothetical protein